MKKILLLLSVVLLALSGCRKWQHQYPEDESRTRWKPIERLTGKNWYLKSATLNGTEYIDTVKNKIGNVFYHFSPGSNDGGAYEMGVVADSMSFGGKWSFLYNEEYISCRANNYIFYDLLPLLCFPFPDYYSYSNESKILKLTEKEFKTQSNIGNDTVIINYFKAQ